MAIQQFPEFTKHVRAKQYKKAFDYFYAKVEDQYLFHALDPLSDKEQDDFWDARDPSAGKYLRVEKKYESKLERWEFAFVTARYLTIPQTIPANGGALPEYAKKYVEEAWGETKSSSLDQNLGYSMQACNYVLTNLKFVAPNWDKYTPATEKKSFEHWDYQADDIRKELREMSDIGKTAKQIKAQQKLKKDLEARLRKLEAKAGKYKNQDDVALYDELRPTASQKMAEVRARQGGYLAQLDLLRIESDMAKIKKRGNCDENSAIAFMFLYDMGVRPIERFLADADHDFVVIGRNDVDPNDYAQWGNTCVVADPWAQGLARGNNDWGTYGGSGKIIQDKLIALFGTSQFSLMADIRMDVDPPAASDPEQRRRKWLKRWRKKD
jgi:hypothetical protein